MGGYSLGFSLPPCVDLEVEARKYRKFNVKDWRNGSVFLYYSYGICYYYQTTSEFLAPINFPDRGSYQADFARYRVKYALCSFVFWTQELLEDYGGEYVTTFDVQMPIFKNTKDVLYISEEFEEHLGGWAIKALLPKDVVVSNDLAW